MRNTLRILTTTTFIHHNCSLCGKMMGNENDDTYYRCVRVIYDGEGDYEVIHQGTTSVKYGVYWCLECVDVPFTVKSSATNSGRLVDIGSKFDKHDGAMFTGYH